MEKTVSREDIDDLRKLFARYDSSKTGVIRPEQLYELLDKTRFPISKTEFKDFLLKIDPIGRNAITFDQLLDGVKIKAGNTSLRQELINAFRVFDSKNTGYVLVKELIAAMKGLNAGMREEEVRELVEEADFDNDGRIEYKKLVEMLFELDG
eukprot:TRINITY_DN11044_c0_g1_i3.p1 TRINITY_DN11044_c0_g1~~TRINITY_DN11044_c0_g1_i3.p1  ORF type:complete len:152 (-),score=51.86 TRINITY_DN11044_c0_g1_i3:156-611(-)